MPPRRPSRSITAPAVSTDARYACATSSNAHDSLPHSLHARYVEPAVGSLSTRAQGRPVLASFVGVFCLFAALPVLAFAGFAVGTILVVGGTALVVATVVISLVLAAAGAPFLARFLASIKWFRSTR